MITSVAFSLRRATMQDIPLLADINRISVAHNLYSLPLDPDSEELTRQSYCKELQGNFDEDGFLSFIAYREKKAYGYITMWDVDAKRVGYIQDMYCTVAKQGIGGLLIDCAKTICKKNKALYLDVHTTDAAKGFYLKKDFKHVEGAHKELYRYTF